MTWTTIPTSVLEVGQPIRSIDIIALRDNILAVPGAAAGAPRVVARALADAMPTIAATPTLALAAAAGNEIEISGNNVNVTGIDVAPAGAVRTCRFTGTGIVLVHSGTFQLQGNANISLSQWTTARFRSHGGGTWTCHEIFPADTRAPPVGSIRQAQLQTATAAISLVVAANSFGAIALTGGTFSWWTASSFWTMHWGSGDRPAGQIGVFNPDPGASATFFVKERFVQASPPYTHGPLFVYLLLDSTGAIVGSSVAPEPTWAYHGPTDITPQRIDMDGRSWRTVRCYDGLPLCEVRNRARAGDRRLMQRVLSGAIEPVETEVEITLAFKDSDRNLCPHPWFSNPAAFFADRTVVLLEPGTALMQRLAQIAADDHASAVRELIDGGYLTIDNTPFAIPTLPAAVRAVRANWRLT